MKLLNLKRIIYTIRIMSCKRNSQFFNVYISKILKSISTEAEICKNSREQLNILLQILTDKIINIVNE